MRRVSNHLYILIVTIGCFVIYHICRGPDKEKGEMVHDEHKIIRDNSYAVADFQYKYQDEFTDNIFERTYLISNRYALITLQGGNDIHILLYDNKVKRGKYMHAYLNRIKCEGDVIELKKGGMWKQWVKTQIPCAIQELPSDVRLNEMVTKLDKNEKMTCATGKSEVVNTGSQYFYMEISSGSQVTLMLNKSQQFRYLEIFSSDKRRSDSFFVEWGAFDIFEYGSIVSVGTKLGERYDGLLEKITYGPFPERIATYYIMGERLWRKEFSPNGSLIYYIKYFNDSNVVKMYKDNAVHLSDVLVDPPKQD